MTPRLDPPKAILAKLDPPAPRAPVAAKLGADTRPGTAEAMNLGTIVTAQRRGSWFFDGTWRVKLGDPNDGYDAETVVTSIDEAAEW